MVLAWVWALLLAVIIPSRADPDLWGHVRFGLDWLSTGRLSYHDPYSFTQDVPWINHEWLSEVQLALAYRAGGATGLVVLKIALLVLSLVALSAALAPLPVLVRGGWLILATWSGIAPITLTVRPHLWSWLLTIVLAGLLLNPPTKRLLLVLPVLFAFWMNVHGGVVVGLGLLGAWTAYHVLAEPSSRALAMTTAAVAVLATLINPYGIVLWKFIAGTVRMGRDIQEWRPISFVDPVGYALPWGLALTAVLAVSLSSARPRWDRLVVLLGLAYASARTMRLVPFFVVISAIYLVPSMVALTRDRWIGWQMRAPSVLAAGIALVPLLPVGMVVHRPLWTGMQQCMPIQGVWAPDLVVARALRDARPQGRLVTHFGWGQFAIWHFGPELRVSFDGRLETVYSEATDLRQVAIERGEPEGLVFLSAVRPEYIWLNQNSTRVRRWLEQRADYRIDVESSDSFLAVRRDTPSVVPTAITGDACFPG